MEAAGILIGIGGLYLYLMMKSYHEDWQRVIRANTTGAERAHRRKAKRTRKEATHTRVKEVSSAPKKPVSVGVGF